MARLNDWRWSSRPAALVRDVRAFARECARIVDSVLPWDPVVSMLRQSMLRQSVSRSLPLAAILIAMCALAAPAAAQTTVNDVHVPPREVDKPKDVVTEASKKELVTDGLSTHVRPLKVDVDLVLVPVTITDPLNRLVTGLDKENFQLFEGNSAQEIRSFSSEDAPVSLGVIFDSSGSMSSKMDRAKDAVVEFFKTANPQDEFFMITFSDRSEERKS